MATLHLSRLVLDPTSAQARAEIQRPYEMHRTLSKAFVPVEASESIARSALATARPLFRIDPGRQPGMVVALVQSRSVPDWTRLTVTPGYLLRPPETRTFEPIFARGQLLAFRLRANPTVRREGKRRGLYQETEQATWLARKAESGGFAVEQAVPITENRALRARRKDEHTEHVVVRFDGILQVRDPVRFAEILASGIGSAKAFGFGLLSVAPLRAMHA